MLVRKISIQAARVLAVVLFVNPIQAQQSKPSAEKEALLLKARKAWSAFECSALATKTGNRGEQERLFKYGLEEGRSFLRAAEANKITKADAWSGIPSGFYFVMEGPSHDFILGRLWESTSENALNDITKSQDGQLVAEEIVKIRAQGKFEKNNCSLLGR